MFRSGWIPEYAADVLRKNRRDLVSHLRSFVLVPAKKSVVAVKRQQQDEEDEEEKPSTKENGTSAAETGQPAPKARKGRAGKAAAAAAAAAVIKKEAAGPAKPAQANPAREYLESRLMAAHNVPSVSDDARSKVRIKETPRWGNKGKYSISSHDANNLEHAELILQRCQPADALITQFIPNKNGFSVVLKE